MNIVRQFSQLSSSFYTVPSAYIQAKLGMQLHKPKNLYSFTVFTGVLGIVLSMKKIHFLLHYTQHGIANCVEVHNKLLSEQQSLRY